jgi:hypothetical protein
MTHGPVSRALQAEVLEEVKRQGIVVWLDKDASYNGFVDELARQHTAGNFPYPVIAFRGSFLETLFALEAYGSGYEKHSLVVHMPGFNEDSIRTTPILELYAAGTRFRKALDTLVRQAATGRVSPNQVEEFLRAKPTLERADEWLSEAVSKASGALETLLEGSGPTLVLEALTSKQGTLAGYVKTEEDAQPLRNYLHRLTGFDDEWLTFAGKGAQASPLAKTLDAFGAWLLCVEYVHDLRREPQLPPLKRLKGLSSALISASTGLVRQLRKSDGDVYARIADEVEGMLDAELSAMSPADFGEVDTFREEENRVLRGAIDALKARQWGTAVGWCKAREGDRSFWLQRDRVRRWVWSLVGEAAAFGRILTERARPFEKVGNFEDALVRYAESGAPVDRAHRRFEQEWAGRRFDTQMPHFGALQEVREALLLLYRDWADHLARDFTRLCKAEGFLPPADLQQRTLYEQVVQPMAFGGEKVAIFLLDAFRYEMATEIVDDLRASGPGVGVDLKARFAELPTITKVGMNALAPVAKEGRLMVAGTLDGFRTGESTVRTPAQRAAAMGMRTSGQPGLCLSLVEVRESTPEKLKKKLKDHRVIVVCSTELDDAGEANVALLTFEQQIQQVKAAWHHLQAAGVKHALFTADHGFLLQDSTTHFRRPFGKKTDPHGRYVLDDHDRGEAGIVPVALSKLGYDGIGGYVLVPEDTAVFDTGGPGKGFIHGGNSPQERIIPVLTVTRKRAEGASLTEYVVEAEWMTDAFGLNRLRLRLTYAKDRQTSLGFAGARAVELDLRVPDRSEIQVTIKEVSGAGKLKSGRVEAPVGDVWTEVFFALTGPTDERVRVEVHHADNIEKVRSSVPDALFAVSGVALGPRPPTMPPRALSWGEAIEDEGVRAVFMHVERHGSITEGEVITMLGNARAARRFALSFDTYLSKLPFAVRSEANVSGKRYVREEK